MEKLKFALFSVVVLGILGLLLFWSVNTLQSGTEHTATQRIEQLENENEELKEEVKGLKSELGLLEAEAEVAQQLAPEEKPTAPSQEPASTTVYKNQALINELQKLINDKITLRLKSSGTRVGTVQKFLNIYNKTSDRVDNDYGASTKTKVAAFQKDQGLGSDGEAGPGTFQKMIGWLKKQG